MIVRKTHKLQIQSSAVNHFSKKFSTNEEFYTQVISRILYLDMNLSGTIIAYRLKHEPPSTTCSKHLLSVLLHLQKQRNFTKRIFGPSGAGANSLAPPRVFHLCMLPYTIVSSYLTLFTLTQHHFLKTKHQTLIPKSGAGRYSLCGTFPS